MNPNRSLIAIVVITLTIVAYYVFSPEQGGHSKPCLFKAGDIVKFKGLNSKYAVYDVDWNCRVTAINEFLEAHSYNEELFEKATP